MDKQYIIELLLSGKLITSGQIQKWLKMTNPEARKFMKELEEELYSQGIALMSNIHGYYIPSSKNMAIEGLEFLHRKAMSIIKRYNQRLKLFKRIYPEIQQYEINYGGENETVQRL